MRRTLGLKRAFPLSLYYVCLSFHLIVSLSLSLSLSLSHTHTHTHTQKHRKIQSQILSLKYPYIQFILFYEPFFHFFLSLSLFYVCLSVHSIGLCVSFSFSLSLLPLSLLLVCLFHFLYFISFSQFQKAIWYEKGKSQSITFTAQE